VAPSEGAGIEQFDNKIDIAGVTEPEVAGLGA